MWGEHGQQQKRPAISIYFGILGSLLSDARKIFRKNPRRWNLAWFCVQSLRLALDQAIAERSMLGCHTICSGQIPDPGQFGISWRKPFPNFNLSTFRFDFPSPERHPFQRHRPFQSKKTWREHFNLSLGIRCSEWHCVAVTFPGLSKRCKAGIHYRSANAILGPTRQPLKIRGWWTLFLIRFWLQFIPMEWVKKKSSPR